MPLLDGVAACRGQYRPIDGPEGAVPWASCTNDLAEGRRASPRNMACEGRADGVGLEGGGQVLVVDHRTLALARASGGRREDGQRGDARRKSAGDEGECGDGGGVEAADGTAADEAAEASQVGIISSSQRSISRTSNFRLWSSPRKPLSTKPQARAGPVRKSVAHTSPRMTGWPRGSSATLPDLSTTITPGCGSALSVFCIRPVDRRVREAAICARGGRSAFGGKPPE